MSTQIGDFMKFRIAQQLFGDGSDVIEAVEAVQNMENDAKAIDKKIELNEKAEEIYESAKKYYEVLKDLAQYPEYVKGINQAYSDCETKFSEIAGSSSYQVYYDYVTSDQNAMSAAVEKRNQINNQENEEDTVPETLSAQEQTLVNIYDAYKNDEEARRDKLADRFEQGIENIENSMTADPINFDNYAGKLDELNTYAAEISDKSGELQTLKEQLESMLEEDNITEELKDGLQDELDKMDELFSQVEYYTEIAEYINSNDTEVNGEYEQQANAILDKMDEIMNSYLDCEENDSDWPDILDDTKWKNFDSVDEYGNLYDSLEKCFGGEGSEDDSKKKKDEANELLENAKEELENSEDSSARDIPSSFGYGTSYQSKFDIGDMAGAAVECFSTNNFANEANKLLLKLYTVEYDFGMFSSRVTNVNNDSENDGTTETAVSLTGYEMSSRINYLYQAELEYILGGSNSSDENLNAARDKILAIRAIVNFTATYSIKEVNGVITEISNAATAVNPVLGLVVNGALRLAVAGMETLMDWNKLKEGESIALIKTKLKHMTAYEELRGLFDWGENAESGDAEDHTLKMNYEQYLMVMTIFLTSSDTIAERTANLIELNVNAAKQNMGKDGTLTELEFKMEDAHTAVNATCTVHLDFAIMPNGFAKSTLSDDTYDSLIEFENNSYSFTVTRGY
jgi:hypothetical protein